MLGRSVLPTTRREASAARRVGHSAARRRPTVVQCVASQPLVASLRNAPMLRAAPGGASAPLVRPEDGIGFSCSLELVLPKQHYVSRHKAAPAWHTDVLELVYVLSGQGWLCETGGGGTWAVHPGMTLVAWAGRTHLVPDDTPAASAGSDSAGPLAVLRFHMPLCTLLHNPGSPSTLAQAQHKLSHILATATADFPSSGAHVGVLDDAIALRLLSAARNRPPSRRTRSPSPPRLQPHTSNHSSSPQRQVGIAGRLHRLASQAASRTLHRAARTSRLLSEPMAWLDTPAPAPARNTATLQPSGRQCVLLARAMADFKAYRFPKQTNQLAFVFEPGELGLPLSFGVEVFEPGHHTPIHIHRTGHEFFFILAGDGDAYCDGGHYPVRAGDVIVFPPGSKHGLDNNSDRKLYALQLMSPDVEMFTDYVQSGTAMGRLDDDDICALTASRC